MKFLIDIDSLEIWNSTSIIYQYFNNIHVNFFKLYWIGVRSTGPVHEQIFQKALHIQEKSSWTTYEDMSVIFVKELP